MEQQRNGLSYFDPMFCDRDMRGQLDRALKEAAALRAENMSSKARANVAEKEKALLEAR